MRSAVHLLARSRSQNYKAFYRTKTRSLRITARSA